MVAKTRKTRKSPSTSVPIRCHSGMGRAPRRAVLFVTAVSVALPALRRAVLLVFGMVVLSFCKSAIDSVPPNYILFRLCLRLAFLLAFVFMHEFFDGGEFGAHGTDAHGDEGEIDEKGDPDDGVGGDQVGDSFSLHGKNLL